MSIAKATLHTEDNRDAKIEVELMQDGEFGGISEFKDFPIMMKLDRTIFYLRKEEANKLAQSLNMTLQEADRREIERRLS